jgi:hypothetical protein
MPGLSILGIDVAYILINLKQLASAIFFFLLQIITVFSTLLIYGGKHICYLIREMMEK